jgi:hypothetical protein
MRFDGRLGPVPLIRADIAPARFPFLTLLIVRKAPRIVPSAHRRAVCLQRVQGCGATVGKQVFVKLQFFHAICMAHLARPVRVDARILGCGRVLAVQNVSVCELVANNERVDQAEFSLALDSATVERDGGVE